jgi:hypothetical protein
MRPLRLRRAEGTGRPVGAAEFGTGLERLLGPDHRTPRSRTQNKSLGQRGTAEITAIGMLSPDLPSQPVSPWQRQ